MPVDGKWLGVVIGAGVSALVRRIPLPWRERDRSEVANLRTEVAELRGKVERIRGVAKDWGAEGSIPYAVLMMALNETTTEARRG